MKSASVWVVRVGMLVFLSLGAQLPTPVKAQDVFALPDAKVGAAYEVPIRAEGGLAPLKWRVAGGELPPGIELLPSGILHGVPATPRPEAYQFTVEVSDSSQPPQSFPQRFSLLVRAAPLRIVLAAGSLHIVTPASSAASPTPADDAAEKKQVAAVQTDPPTTGGTRQDTAASADPTPQSTTPGASSGKPGGQLLRSIVGFEQAGASASNSTQKFFFDLLVSRPVAFRRRSSQGAPNTKAADPTDLGPRMRSWGNLRVSSVPQQISASVAQFAAAFAQTVGELQVNKVAQSFEFLGGLDVRLLESGSFASFDKETSQRFSLNLVLGGGVITPITPLDSVQIFKVPSNQPDFFKRFPQAAGRQFVAFTLPDRDRFFRQAYGGIRLMTHFIEDKANNPKIRFPATFDITYGFNESVTGGRIRGGVLRLEGFVPLPYSRASWVYLFGTGLFKPGAHAQVQSPFLLDAAPAGTLPTDPNAVVITTPQIDRDFYRIGIGIDLVDLIANWSRRNGHTSQPASPNPNSPQARNP